MLGPTARQLQQRAAEARAVAEQMWFRGRVALHFGCHAKTERLADMTIYRTRYRDPKEHRWVNAWAVPKCAAGIEKLFAPQG